MRYANKNEKRMWDQLKKNNPYVYTKWEMIGNSFTMLLMGTVLGVIVGLVLLSSAHGQDPKTQLEVVFSGAGYSQHVLTIENNVSKTRN